MIYLITGKPGNGKTLFALDLISKRAVQEKRQVYYYGIPLTKQFPYQWIALKDPQKWFECPPNSIVVYDEAQNPELFPPRANGSKAPLHVSELTTHRHGGLDMYFMTQDPSFVDNHVKKLCEEHHHLIRQFGMQKSTVYFANSALSSISNATLKGTIQSTFSFPPEVYGWYESAQVHTHKRKIPARLILFWCLPPILIALIWVSWQKVSALGKSKEKEITPSELSVPPAFGRVPSAAPIHKETVAEYVEKHQPRVEGLAYTAPVFDDLTKPVAVPAISACLASKSKCTCYTQQATILTVPSSTCRQIARDGYFQTFAAAPAAPVPLQSPPPAAASPNSPMVENIQPLASGTRSFETNVIANRASVSPS